MDLKFKKLSVYFKNKKSNLLIILKSINKNIIHPKFYSYNQNIIANGEKTIHIIDSN